MLSTVSVPTDINEGFLLISWKTKFADAIHKTLLYGNKSIFPVPPIASSQKSPSELGSLSLKFNCGCLFWQSYYIMHDSGTLWALHIDPSLLHAEIL